MKFTLGSIFRIVDDRIPVATRGVGATCRCWGRPAGVGATHRSPLRVSCLLSSTIIALPNGNGVNTGFKSRLMALIDVGVIFYIYFVVVRRGSKF